MGRKRGFFAELQYQQQLAERQRLQAARAEERARAAADREAERTRKAAERAAAAAQRASAAEQKAAEKEAKRLHLEARQAEVEVRNARLAALNEELGSILSATLDVDDFVDLEELRTTPELPPFDRTDLERPTPEVDLIAAPPEPTFEEPAAPSGLGAVFGGKKKHAAAVAEARAVFEAEHARWEREVAAVPEKQLRQQQEWDAKEQRRLELLAEAQADHQQRCDAVLAAAAEDNARLDALIAGVAIGEPNAVQEYVGIVLGNSVYVEVLNVEHDFEFDPVTRELALTVLIAPPDALPEDKAYRYVKSSDEVVATPLSKKDLKTRYASVVHQVAVRSLHEVFEADRAGVVRTIALEVATETFDPATGLERRISFVRVGVDRQTFASFRLDNVMPLATLEHLGAAISKNPYELVALPDGPAVGRR